MSEEYRTGYVYIQNHLAGIIAETEEGYIFSYLQEYLNSMYISPSGLTAIYHRKQSIFMPWKISVSPLTD